MTHEVKDFRNLGSKSLGVSLIHDFSIKYEIHRIIPLLRNKRKNFLLIFEKSIFHCQRQKQEQLQLFAIINIFRRFRDFLLVFLHKCFRFFCYSYAFSLDVVWGFELIAFYLFCSCFGSLKNFSRRYVFACIWSLYLDTSFGSDRLQIVWKEEGLVKRSNQKKINFINFEMCLKVTCVQTFLFQWLYFRCL